MEKTENLLEINNLVVRYGGIEAVRGISFGVPKGKIVTLIGSNGAGKSSTLRSVVGLVKPAGGSIPGISAAAGQAAFFHSSSRSIRLQPLNRARRRKAPPTARSSPLVRFTPASYQTFRTVSVPVFLSAAASARPAKRLP